MIATKMARGMFGHEIARETIGPAIDFEHRDQAENHEQPQDDHLGNGDDVADGACL
jgi:hypothetical protein